MAEVRFGDRETEHLLLVIEGRAHPASSDYWDGNWLNCVADVVAGAFHGRLPGSLRVDELEQFRHGLAQLYERLAGEVTLEPMERWLRLSITGDGRGHLEARCVLTD